MMKITRESIFSSVVRAFFVMIFGLLGLGVGLLLIMFLFSAAMQNAGAGIPPKPSLLALPNAEGVRHPFDKEKPVILQIDIKGVIGMEQLNTDTVYAQLLEAQNEHGYFAPGQVKAILLNVNTPGGTATDSYGIYKLLKDFKEKHHIPVYVYIDGLCASGGMYVSSAADKILASEMSIAGSVGVVVHLFNISTLLDKIGVQNKVISIGKDKDMLNPFRPWKADEEKPLQEISQYLYDHFVDVVSKARPKLTKELLTETYGAQIFDAAKAQELGYIDVYDATWNQAVAELAAAADIAESYQVVALQMRSWVHDLLENKSPLITGQVKHRVELPPEWSPELANKPLFLYEGS